MREGYKSIIVDNHVTVSGLLDMSKANVELRDFVDLVKSLNPTTEDLKLTVDEFLKSKVVLK
jgi:hypothetical protein